MAPTAKPRVVTLLITGFGPYSDAPDENISTTVARRLAGVIIEKASHPNLRIRLVMTSFLTVYSDVTDNLPAFHQSGLFDGFIHLGLRYGFPGVALENQAERLGYDRKDMEGQLGPAVSGGRGIEGDVERWNTSLSVESLALTMQRAGHKHVFPSYDAGGYLCGFIYATSLKCALAQAKHTQPKPVLFCHIPDPKQKEGTRDHPERGKRVDHRSPYTEDEIVEVTKEVCWNVGLKADEHRSTGSS